MLNSQGKSKIISLNPAIELQLEAKFNGVHLTNYKFHIFSFAWIKKSKLELIWKVDTCCFTMGKIFSVR